MKYNIITIKDYVIFKPETSELGIGERKELENLFEQAVEKKGKLVLDLSSVQSIDSTILAVFLRFSKRLAGLGSELVICNTTENVTGIFQLTKLDYIISVRRTLEDVIGE